MYKTMLTYCLKCRIKAESKNAKFVKIQKWKNYAFIKMCNVR